MTAAPLNVFARRAVSQLAAIDPNGAAETMHRLNDRIEQLERDLSKERGHAQWWRLQCMNADDELQAVSADLARSNIEILDLRRHLQTMQTELLRFEEAV